MPDQAAPAIPRVALVFGDEAAVAHVRDAMGDQAEIVYAATADDFDVSHMTGAGAAAALVNLDDGDWLDSLDSIETQLNDAGVAVVFNDPDISNGLEGWERARWLRHLVAKLRGSNDVDPPRPPAPEPAARTADVAAPVTAEPEVAPTPVDGAVAERPLSPEEIETMTVAFVAEQASTPAPVDPQPRSAVPDSTSKMESLDVDSVDVGSFAESEGPSAAEAQQDEPMPTTVMQTAADALPAAGPGPDDETLDVDTETLSAMIDARLAEPESRAASDSTQVWREASGGATSPVRFDTSDVVDATPPAAAEAIVTPAQAAQDDADVLASLPSLDDWQLIDPETPSVAAEKTGRKSPEPEVSGSFAGLELVPMEMISPIQHRVEPIERWMHGSQPGKPQTGTDDTAATAKVGEGQS